MVVAVKTIDGNAKVWDWNIHSALSRNLDHIKVANSKDIDFKILISGDGKTRTGKTTQGTQMACYLDPSFLPNWQKRMVYDGQELIRIANTMQPGECLIYDEARQVLNSKNQMNGYAKNLMNFFSQCGSKNLYIIIILPDFFELPKSIALVQSVYLINCHFMRGFERGFFDFFNHKQKKYLYIRGQKFLDYKAVLPSFRGTFTKFFPISKIKYENNKQKKLQELRDKEKEKPKISHFVQIHKARLRRVIEYLRVHDKLKVKEIGPILQMDPGHIHTTYFTQTPETLTKI